MPSAKSDAAAAMKLNSENLLQLEIIDTIIKEPLGGAHWDYAEAGTILKNFLIPVIKELTAIPPDQRSRERIEKFNKMGFWEEKAVEM